MKIEDLKFNGKLLSDYGFVAIDIDTDKTFGLNRDIISGEINSVRNTINCYGTKYKEPLMLKYLLIKDTCYNHSQQTQKIDIDELRIINKWLTSPKTPKCLTVDTKEYAIREYYGIFTEVSPYEADNLYGIEIAFTCNSPYGFDLNKQTYICENSKQITINNPTDELEEYIYPTITIEPNGCTEFSIQNLSDENRVMIFNFKSEYSKIIIDCYNQRIIADGNLLSLDEVGWSIFELSDYNNINTGVFDLYWLRFIPTSNILVLNGNGKITLDYKTPVKVGGFY